MLNILRESPLGSADGSMMADEMESRLRDLEKTVADLSARSRSLDAMDLEVRRLGQSAVLAAGWQQELQRVEDRLLRAIEDAASGSPTAADFAVLKNRQDMLGRWLFVVGSGAAVAIIKILAGLLIH